MYPPLPQEDNTMTEIALFFLIAFVLILFALEIPLVNTNKKAIASILWLGIIAFSTLLWGVKLYLAQSSNLPALSLIQRFDDAAWVHQAWIVWLFGWSLTLEKQNLPFPKEILILFGVSSLFSLISLGYGLFDSLYLSPFFTGNKTIVGIIIAPSTARIFAETYTLVSYGLTIAQLFYKYFAVQYTFQKRNIRYFLSGLTGAVLFFFVGKTTPSLFFFQILAPLILGITLFYIGNNFRTLQLRDKVTKLLILVFMGTLLMIFPAGILYVFRQWFMSLPVELFVLIFSLGMGLYFVLSLLLLSLIQRIIRQRRDNEEFSSLVLRLLGNKRSREEFASELAKLIKEITSYDVDVLLREDNNFPIVSSSRNKTGETPLSPQLIHYFTSGEIYYDRESVLNYRPGKKDIDLLYAYFDSQAIEALLALVINQELHGIIHLIPTNEQDDIPLRTIRKLKSLLKLVEVLYQNLLLFEKEEERTQTLRELALASEIQETIFQRTLPVIRDLDIASYQEPAKWLSGDYLFVDSSSNHEISFVVADVSGKGVSAALITMMIHSAVQGHVFSSSTINSFLNRINELLTRKKPESEWKTLSVATVLVGFVDTEIQTLYYSNAGHYPILIWDRNKREFYELSTGGKPVGIFAESEYETGVYHYDKDQIFIVYSDGITECINSKEEEFGIQRLKKLIQQYDNLPAKSIVEEILKEIKAFTEEADIYDDMTLFIMKT